MDLLIYHDNTTTSIIRAKNLESGIKMFKTIKGKGLSSIDEVYDFNRSTGEKELISDWKEQLDNNNE